MDERLDILEHEVRAIQSDLAVIKTNYWMREEARVLDGRLSHVESQIVILVADVAQLKNDVAQLKNDVAQLKNDVAKLTIEVVQIQGRLEHLPSRVELIQIQANLKVWMVGIAITTITLVSSMQLTLFSALP